MSSDHPVNKKPENKDTKRATDGSAEGSPPEWANGLKQLYNSVVDEPLPDSFKDLLAQFDDEDAAKDNRPEAQS